MVEIYKSPYKLVMKAQNFLRPRSSGVVVSGLRVLVTVTGWVGGWVCVRATLTLIVYHGSYLLPQNVTKGRLTKTRLVEQ